MLLLWWPNLSAATQTTSAPSPAQTSASRYFYTLQATQDTDLAALEKAAESFVGLVTFRVRIVKEEENYAIRIGKSPQSDELEALIPSLKSVGFWTAALLYMPTDKEEVVKIITPGLPESSRQPDQPYLLQTQQDKPPAVARRMSELFPRETELSRLARLKKAMDKEPPGEGDAVIKRAWEIYRHGSLMTACELFESAQNLPGVEREALRGLAHCFLQIGNYEEAIALFSWLIPKDADPEQNRSRLVEALFKAGKFDTALEEAYHLNEAQALQWKKLISASKEKIEMEQIQKRYDPKKPEEFVEKYRGYLERCLIIDSFLTAAKDLAPAKNEAALRLYNQILDACAGQWDVKLSAYTSLMQNLPLEITRAHIDQELKRINLPSDYREKLLAKLAQSSRH